jgi:hypothetical protein
MRLCLCLFDTHAQAEVKWGWQGQYRPPFSPYDEDDHISVDPLHAPPEGTGGVTVSSGRLKKFRKKKVPPKKASKESLSHSYLPPAPDIMPDVTQVSTQAPHALLQFHTPTYFHTVLFATRSVLSMFSFLQT